MNPRTKFVFSLGSRKLFPEESGVVDAVQKAFSESAKKQGVTIKRGSALFRVTSNVVATPTVESAVQVLYDKTQTEHTKSLTKQRTSNSKKLASEITKKPGAHRSY